MTTLEQMGQNAKQAARFLLTAGELKNKALLEIADALIANADEIVKPTTLTYKSHVKTIPVNL